MKKKVVFALSLVAGVVLMSLAADPTSGKKSDDSDTIRELRAQITELRAEVNQLHQRTETLESSVEELKRSHIPTPLNLQPGSAVPSPSTIIPSPSSSRPPTVWGQGEVNGWTYYIVPCEQQSR